MLTDFPKIRPELPAEYAAIYALHYKSNREGGTSAASLSQRMESWMHKKTALYGTGNKTLEIGAGTLNQLPYEKPEIYDVVEPFTELYENAPEKEKVRKFYSDISDVPITEKYDRITSVATFEHILNLPEVVANSALLLNSGGMLLTAIPNEGTFLWKLGYKLTTGIEFRLKYGLDYSVLMNYEHVNTADEVELVLKTFFKKTTCSVFGLNKKIGFYRFYVCTQPDKTKAENYLKNLHLK